MKIFAFLLITLIITTFASSQEIYTYVEDMPKADYKLYDFITKNIKYPQDAIDQNIEGKVYVKFIVDSFGNIVNPYVLRSVQPLLDSEAVRVIKSLPAWRPGKQNGKDVSVYYTLPITFRLTKDTFYSNNEHYNLILPNPHFELRKYINSRLVYPKFMLKDHMSGTVTVEYTIDTLGNLINLQTVKSTFPDFAVEVNQVFKEMPRWLPGTLDNKVVCIRLSQTFNFTIISKSNRYVDGGIIFTTPSFISANLPCW